MNNQEVLNNNKEEEQKGVPMLISNNEGLGDNVSTTEAEDVEENDEMDDIDAVDCIGDDSGTTDCINDENDDSDSAPKMERRRSQVANAVQEMIRISESAEEGIGEQIRVMAQEQEQERERLEASLSEVSKRGGFARFFIGPNYSEIKKAEQYVEKYNERLEKMGELSVEVTGEDFTTAIQSLKEVGDELDQEIENQKGGFSLFGWLNRLFN